MDELDLTEAEKMTAFDEVSSLYIAQVKQQCGIIERENYNKPKSEDARQPQCPPEKEALCAFKTFQIRGFMPILQIRKAGVSL